MKSLLRTDKGHVRIKNEDAAFAGDGLFILCDGMGGHQGGEVASTLAVELLSRQLGEEVPSVGPLLRAVTHANEQIFACAQVEKTLYGMGTTLTLLWRAEDQALIAQVGDSRAYLLRGGLLQQCTHDHSIVADLLRAGQITAEEAWTHPNRNLLTRALGTEPRVEPDVFEYGRQAGDRWLLCSDGLTDLVRDSEIASILLDNTREAAGDKLLETALMRGGTDNVTLLIIDDEGGDGI